MAHNKPTPKRFDITGLGRLKKRERNKTEAAYEAVLLERMAAGEILWYDFEAITFTLANDCRYTPDFPVMLPNGEIEIHEVKGSKFVIKDDARVKIKVAARLFPFVFKLCIPRTKKQGGGWEITEV